MLISVNWLKRYVELEDVKVDDIAVALTSLGLEVEGIKNVASGSNLVIAHVVDKQKHENSDKLSVCQVDFGQGLVQVVCGAQNVAKGQNIIFAKVGAELPGDFKIKAAKVRDVESNGMICSLSELGVEEKLQSEESKKGIEVLPSDAPIGQEPLKYLGLDDTIIEIKMTPNRVDCYSMIQVANEVAAYFKKQLKRPLGHKFESKEVKDLINTDKSVAFTSTIVKGVKNAQSPAFIKDVLRSAGINSKNLLVDISNYVMLETGQPMHFYDLRKVDGVKVEAGHKGQFVGIDGNEYTINEEDLVIVSNGKIVGLAGIMGSKESGIEGDTTDILIEVAHFEQTAIRKTANRLQLFTDSAVRYMKGRDNGQIKYALELALGMLKEFASASTIETTSTQGEIVKTNKEIKVDFDFINSYLGTDISVQDMKDYLIRLGYEMNSDIILVPSIRQDVTIMVDIVEEIGRIYGYDNIKSEYTNTKITKVAKLASKNVEDTIREQLTSYGLDEAITYQLTSQKAAQQFALVSADDVRLAMPMSEDRAVLRKSILPSILEVIKYNRSRKQNDLGLFEISKVYGKDVVKNSLAIAICGELKSNKWRQISIQADFFTLKGIIETLLQSLGLTQGRYLIERSSADDKFFHPGKSAVIKIGKDIVGQFGQIHPTVEKEMKLSNVYVAQIDLDIIAGQKIGQTKASPISVYQQVEKDFAFEVAKTISAGTVIDAVKKGARKMATSVELFDLYTGSELGENKSIAIRVILEDQNKTLTNEEITEIYNSIVEAAASVGAKIRM